MEKYVLENLFTLVIKVRAGDKEFVEFYIFFLRAGTASYNKTQPNTLRELAGGSKG